eukprot:scaffold2159_cov170-Pinguiococcus_pyrenoidosus.AAC.4
MLPVVVIILWVLLPKDAHVCILFSLGAAAVMVAIDAGLTYFVSCFFRILERSVRASPTATMHSLHDPDRNASSLSPCSTSMHPSMPRRTRPRVQSASPRAPVSAAALPRSAPGHSGSRT